MRNALKDKKTEGPLIPAQPPFRQTPRKQLLRHLAVAPFPLHIKELHGCS